MGGDIMRYPEVAKRFQIILNKRNMKARDLANRANMTEAAISHYVHGNRCPGNKAATILANILGCNPLWLMDLSPNMEITPNTVTVASSGIIGDINHIANKLDKPSQERLLAYAQGMYDIQNQDKKGGIAHVETKG